MTNIILFDDYSDKALSLMSNVLWGRDVESLDRSEIIQLLKLLRWNLDEPVDLRQETSVLRKTLIDLRSWIHTYAEMLSFAEKYSKEVEPHRLVHAYFTRLYNHNVDFKSSPFLLPRAYSFNDKGISVIRINDYIAREEVWNESDFPPVTITVGTTQYKSLVTFLKKEVGMYPDDSVYKLYDEYLRIIRDFLKEITDMLTLTKRIKEDFIDVIIARRKKGFFKSEEKFFSSDLWERMHMHNLILNELVKASTAVLLVKSNEVEFKFDLPSLKEFTKADASITLPLDTQNNKHHKYGLGTERRFVLVEDDNDDVINEIPF